MSAWKIGGLAPVDDSGDLARVVYSESGPIALVTADQRESIAALVAAAPDLLAVCQLALGTLHAEYANHPPAAGSVREAQILETKIALRRVITSIIEVMP